MSDISAPAHPKSVQEQFAAALNVENKVDTALHTQNGDVQQQMLQEVSQYLSAMKPVEREGVGSVLNSMAKNLDDSDKRVSSRQALPLPQLELDGNRDIKSLTFKSISDDEAFGKTLSVSLDNKNTSEGQNTQEYRLPDGELRVVARDAQKQIASIQDSGGNYIERSADGKSYTRTDDHGQVFDQFSGFTVDSDGSLNYSVKNKGNFHESVDANGKVDVQGKIGSISMHQDEAHDLLTFRGDNGTITRNIDGSKMVFEPSNGGKLTYADGSLTVQFPDGVVKVYSDVTAEELKKSQDASDFKVVWKPDHHFNLETR